MLLQASVSTDCKHRKMWETNWNNIILHTLSQTPTPASAPCLASMIYLRWFNEVWWLRCGDWSFMIELRWYGCEDGASMSERGCWSWSIGWNCNMFSCHANECDTLVQASDSEDKMPHHVHPHLTHWQHYCFAFTASAWELDVGGEAVRLSAGGEACLEMKTIACWKHYVLNGMSSIEIHTFLSP